jgi:hypothetical protein
MTKKILLIITTLFSVSGAFFISCGAASKSDGCPIGFIRAKAGNCVENLECLTQEKCIKTGKCTYTQGTCVATTNKDCSKSENCPQLGECVLELNREGTMGLCVASAAGCLHSEVCYKYGKCTPGPQGFCIVTSDKECAQSQICKNEGRCKVKEVRRVDGRKSNIMACQAE